MIGSNRRNVGERSGALVGKDRQEARSREQLLAEVQSLRGQLSDLAALTSAAPVGLCLIDRDLRFRYVNEWLAAVNGRSVADHLGASVDEILPAIAREVVARYRKVLETGLPNRDIEVVAHLPPGSGDEHTWLVADHPVLDADGQVVGIVTAVQDISERKQLERTLSAIVNAAPAGLCLLDRDLRIVHINDWLRHANGGRAAAEFLGRRVPDAVPGIAEQVMPHLRESLETGRDLPGIEVVGQQTADSGPTVWWMHVHPVRDANGRVQQLVVSVQDISTRKQAEQEVGRALERLTRSQEVGGFGSYDWDLTTGDLWWSDSMYVLYGVSPRSFKPDWDGWFELVVAEDHVHVRAQLDRALVEPGPHAVEFRITREGSERVLLSSGMLERDALGNPLRFVGTMMDVTERFVDRERLVHEREQLSHDLQERTRELDRLLDRLRRRR